jgi:hypothetical protein
MSKVFARIEIPFIEAMPGNSLHDFTYEWMLKEYERRYDDKTDMLYLLGTTPDAQPTFAIMTAIVQSGGRFDGIKLGIEIGWAQRTNNVPAGIRGRDYVDENGDPQVYTWAEWVAAGNLSYKKKNDDTIAIFKGAWKGELLNSEELEIIHTLAYANVIELQDLIDRSNSPEYNDEEIIP